MSARMLFRCLLAVSLASVFFSWPRSVAARPVPVLQGNPKPVPESLKNNVGVMGGCTATALAPRIAIWAAHCQNTPQANTKLVLANGKSANYVCKQHTGWAGLGGRAPDVAICWIPRDQPALK